MQKKYISLGLMSGTSGDGVDASYETLQPATHGTGDHDVPAHIRPGVDPGNHQVHVLDQSFQGQDAAIAGGALHREGADRIKAVFSVLGAVLKLLLHAPGVRLDRRMKGQASAHAALLPVGRHHDDLANLSQGPGRSPDAWGCDSIVIYNQYLHVSRYA